MFATSDPILAKAEVEKAYRIKDVKTAALDCLTAAAPLVAKVAYKDAIRAAEATIATYTPWLLEKAVERGEDFFSLDCGAYSVNYELEGGRWEAFVSFAR